MYIQLQALSIIFRNITNTWLQRPSPGFGLEAAIIYLRFFFTDGGVDCTKSVISLVPEVVSYFHVLSLLSDSPVA